MLLLTSSLLSHIMRHLCWNLDGKLYYTCDNTIMAPWRLVDKLVYTLFFDGIDVRFASFQNMFDDAYRALLVAGSHIMPEEGFAAPPDIGFYRFVVHV